MTYPALIKFIFFFLSYIFLELQSDTSSKKDERIDCVSGAEDEHDITSLIESDTSMVPHYSTPISKSPTEESDANQKRPYKSHHNSNAKRAKCSDTSSTNNKAPSVSEQDTVNSTEHVSEDETDYIEVPNLKLESLEHDEAKEPLKQLLMESNGNASSVDGSTQDNGRCILCFFILFFE